MPPIKNKPSSKRYAFIREINRIPEQTVRKTIDRFSHGIGNRGRGFIHIHLCTKDRPEMLKKLLQDIDMVVTLPKKVFVYDDSVDSTNRQNNRALLEAAPFHTIYVDEQRRRHLLHIMPWPSQQAATYAEYGFKELGNPSWDHAGVRAFAQFVAGSIALSRQKILLLDDDMRLTEAIFQGRHYVIQSQEITKTLTGSLPRKVIVGARYIGRTDVYLPEHIKQAYLSQLSPQAIKASKKRIFAYRGSKRLHRLESEIEISGAFLFLHGEDVCAVPIPHCYNEDNIFTAILEAYGRTIRIASFSPMHVGNEVVPDIEVAPMQQKGGVMLKAICRAIKEVGVSDIEVLTNRAMAHCELYLEEHIAIWRELFNNPLVHEYGDITAENSQNLLDKAKLLEETTLAIRDYFESWPGWQDLVKAPRVAAHLRRQLAVYERVAV